MNERVDDGRIMNGRVEQGRTNDGWIDRSWIYMGRMDGQIVVWTRVGYVWID